jgi:hypothetical protein
MIGHHRNHDACIACATLTQHPAIKSIIQLQELDSQTLANALDSLPTYFLPPPETTEASTKPSSTNDDNDQHDETPPTLQEAAEMVADQISKAELDGAMKTTSTYKAHLESDIQQRTALINTLSVLIEKHEYEMLCKADLLNVWCLILTRVCTLALSHPPTHCLVSLSLSLFCFLVCAR